MSNVINLFSKERVYIKPEMSKEHKARLDKFEKLQQITSYSSTFDMSVYHKLELRFALEEVRGGVIYKQPLKLIDDKLCFNSYGRGCTHDVITNPIKNELGVHGFWNKPFPFPSDITELWTILYTVFETNKKSKWREHFEARKPLTFTLDSDSFMFMDRKYKVTQEVLKMLNHYDYPYEIHTRSDLIASDTYKQLLDPKLSTVYIRIDSTNDQLNRLIELGAPSALRRLKALQKLINHNIEAHVQTRAYFTNYDLDQIDTFGAHGALSVDFGVDELSSKQIYQIEQATGTELKDKVIKDAQFYLDRMEAKCKQNGI